MLPRETHDPWGRRVVLTSARWVHVLEGHPEMFRYLDETLSSVCQPDAITPDPIRGRWRYWRTGLGPTHCLFVVVDWHTEQPQIITAYGQPKIRL